MTDDATLLSRYAERCSEDAFAELVRRHLPLVYSAAMRRLGGDTHRAADVTQFVFATLARDASRLSRHAVLTGWLYTATRNAAIDVVRKEKRRRVREQEAHTMQEISDHSETAADWASLKPVLDEVMDRLDAADREAVLLRFFQDRPFAEIAGALGLSEDAARKRTGRAVDQLRGLLRRHGITSTSTALATVLASETILAAPSSLAASIVGAAVASASATAGTVTFMSMTKLWIGIGAAAVIGGTGGLVSQQRTIAQLRKDESHTQQQLVNLSAENAAHAKAQNAAERELAKLRTELAAAKSSSRETNRAAVSNAVPPQGIRADAVVQRSPAEAAARQQQLEHWHQRFDGFVRQRGLTPEQADKLFEILGDWDDVSRDFQASIRAQGLTATPEAQKLRDRLQQQIEVEPLIALLGRDGERAYFEFENNSFYQGMVEPLAKTLTLVDLPLTDDQTTRLVALVKSNVHLVKRDPTAMGSEAVIDWAPVLATAGSFLDPKQVVVIQAQVARQNTGGH